MMELDVAIVGGGFSGSAVATHLGLRGHPGLRLALFEPGRLGCGAAYGTQHSEHLLNTRAHSMSMYSGDPDHFVRWLGARATPDDFVSRQLYGQYVHETSSRAFDRSGFFLVPSRASHVRRRSGGGFIVQCASGECFASQAVILATGNSLPDDTFLPRDVLRSPHYIADPWRCDYRGVSGEIVIIGSGLSALDVLVALHAQGHDGTVSLLSRHRRFPSVHADVSPYDVVPVLDPRDARSLLRSFRRHVEEARRRGYDWRSIVDAVRSESEATWRRLSLAEQRRFDRHLRPRWERLRHRAPQQVDRVRRLYQRAGRLAHYAGRLIEMKSDEVTIRLNDGPTVTLHQDWIINCSGVGRSQRLREDPLLTGMFADGTISVAGNAFGLRTDANLTAIGNTGRPTEGLWVVGPPARGSRFEATAVPEIRTMAQEVADQVLRRAEPRVRMA